MCMCVCTCGYVSALFTLSPYSSDLRYAHKHLRYTHKHHLMCVCMCVHVCVCKRVVQSIAILPEVHVFMNKYMHTHTCVRVHTSGRHSLYPCLAKGTHASPENTYMFVFVCVYVCVCVCVCVCVYTCVRTMA